MFLLCLKKTQKPLTEYFSIETQPKYEMTIQLLKKISLDKLKEYSLGICIPDDPNKSFSNLATH